GISIKSFPALLFPDSGLDEKTKAEIFPFAYINQQVLRQLGGDYAKLEQLQPQLKKDQVSVNEHEPPTSVEITNLPEIKTFEFEFATITITEIKLQPFDFEVAKIEFKKSGWFKEKTELNINKQKKQARQFIENLSDGI
ncbi:MAG: formylglycine-generating enzyme family protein, partial [Dolichospermum sp.]